MATIESFVPILDLGGTFVFAISGAVAAVNRRLDIFGILVLSFVTGNLGGITRDVLIGAVPPAALIDGRYLLVSVLAGLITFFWYAGVNRLRTPVLLFDAAGTLVLRSRRHTKGRRVRIKSGRISSFGHVNRHRRRHDARRAPFRDPAGAAFRSLRRCGAGGRADRCNRQCAGLSYGVSALAGGALCFGLRFMAIRHGWHLPVAHLSAQGRAGIDQSNDKSTTRGGN